MDRPKNRLDVAVIEASAITEEGGIICGASVGASPEIIQMADKIIIEVNTLLPSFEGLHDITMTDLPPRRKPYLIMSPDDRIGTPHIPVDPDRIVAIVESRLPDVTNDNAPEDATSQAVADNLIEFLQHEVKMVLTVHIPMLCIYTNTRQPGTPSSKPPPPPVRNWQYRKCSNWWPGEGESLLLKPDGMDRSPTGLLPRPFRFRPPELCYRNFSPLFPGRVQALL